MSESMVSFYTRRARALYARNEFDKAIVDLREALRLAPDSPRSLPWILNTLADCYFCKREWDQAIEYYSRSIALLPNDPYARRWRANVYTQMGDAQKASADFEELARIAPEIADSTVSIYTSRAERLYAQNEYDKAIVELREALKLGPDTQWSLAILNRLADCYFCKREWGTAIEYYSECIGKGPTDPYAWRWRANAYMKKGDTEKALADLDELVRIAPGDAESHMMIGYVHSSLGNHERAIEAYTQAIRLAPSDPSTHSKRGEAYTSAGRHDLAIKDHDRAIELALLKSAPKPNKNDQGPELN